MNLRYAVAAALAAGGLVATPVIAQNAYSDIEPQFYWLDKNNDGNVDQAEAQGHPWLQRNFSSFDHDRNGKLGKDEFKEAVEAHRAARAKGPSAAPSAAGGTRPVEDVFENLDKNNDGAIDTTEVQVRPWLQREFSQYDTNPKDGKLNKYEFTAALNARRAAVAGGTRPAEDVFENLDKNNDGTIDATEAKARPWLQGSFSQYDTNPKDGKLNKDEFNAALSAQRAAPR